MIYHFFVGGLVRFASIAWLVSTERQKVARKTVALGFSPQLAIGLLNFHLPGSQQILRWLNDAVLALLNASKAGTTFLFGPLAPSPLDTSSVGSKPGARLHFPG